MLSGVYNDVTHYLKKNKFVVTLGGEHSISAAPIKAHADHHGPISILHFDAHADLDPAYEGNPHSHASVISRVKELNNVTSVVSVGIRSVSDTEKQFVDPQQTFFAHNIHANPACLDRVISLLSPKVYITFDLDVFDSSLMPSTGTPEPGGLFWHQVTPLIKQISQTHTIVGFDIVELCPIKNFIAPNFLAAKLVYKMLSCAKAA